MPTPVPITGAALPKRAPETHKGDYGRVLIIAGSVGYTGAPTFAARAAVRSGAGLVFLGVPVPIYTVTAVKNDEAMVFPLPSGEGGQLSPDALDPILERLAKCDACLVGPGLGLSKGTAKLVRKLLTRCTVPLILDADGINALAAHIDRLDKASCPVYLTPHEGEFRRLCPDTGAERFQETSDFARNHHVTLIRKAHRTLVALPDGTLYENTTGNPGMAKGGSGDVLAGMLLGLLGQRIPDAAQAAVYLHGLAGDRCAERYGEYAMTPSDMIEELGNCIRPSG